MIVSLLFHNYHTSDKLVKYEMRAKIKLVIEYISVSLAQLEIPSNLDKLAKGTPAFTILCVCLATKDKLAKQNVENLSNHWSDLLQILKLDIFFGPPFTFYNLIYLWLVARQTDRHTQ